MPSYLHEVLVEMFRDRPVFAAELLTGLLGMPVPAFEQARVSSADLTNVAPTEYRADAVIVLTVGNAPVLGVVVEVQLGRKRRKRRVWPAYVANLYARLGCPVSLLVVCRDRVTAAWCGMPIMVGVPGYMLTPLVLGPAEVPVVTDPTLARRQPELAVLSAMVHGSGRVRRGSSTRCWLRWRRSIRIMRTCILTSCSRRCRRRSETTWRL